MKTLKRDYARVAVLSNAHTILGLVSAWIEDYNCASQHPSAYVAEAKRPS